MEGEEWELYSLLVPTLFEQQNDSSNLQTKNQEEKIMEENDMDDDFVVMDECAEVKFQSLLPLKPPSSDQKAWYMKERVSNSIEEQYEKDPLINSSSNDEPDSVQFYLDLNTAVVEFVYIKSSSHNNEMDYSKLPEDIIDDPEMFKAMYRYSELARGAYAPNQIELRKRTGLTDAEIYHYDFQEWRGMHPRPAFYLAIDETLKCLVLAIRGTKTAVEMKIDAKWEPAEFPQVPGAYVHQGILLAARWFIDNLLGRIVQISDLFPEYPIRVVGHSLGGGIAALFALMTKDVLPNIKAVTFAPLSCVSSSLLPLCNECCISFINRTDTFPFLTHAKFNSMFTYKQVLDGDYNNLTAVATNQNTHPNSPIVVPPTSSEPPAPRLIHLYPPGELLHIFKSEAKTLHLRKVTHKRKEFTFALSRKMVRHHKLESYKRAFISMCRMPKPPKITK